MSAAEAQATAEKEGLTLLRADNSTGFKGVSHDPRCSKPFNVGLWHGGRRNCLGTFATAEEAALAVARFLGPEGVATAAASSPSSLKRPAASSATESARKRGKQPADIYFVQAELAADNDERAVRLNR